MSLSLIAAVPFQVGDSYGPCACFHGAREVSFDLPTETLSSVPLHTLGVAGRVGPKGGQRDEARMGLVYGQGVVQARWVPGQAFRHVARGFAGCGRTQFAEEERPPGLKSVRANFSRPKCAPRRASG